jgi:hypothetical protein
MARAPLPHPLGTIEGTCPYSVVEPPGQPVGTRFFGFDETLEAVNMNRVAYALMENVDYLYTLGQLVVVAPAGGDGDYVGHDALASALADGHKLIFVKTGAYTPTADITVAQGARIYGEGPVGPAFDMASNKVELLLTSGVGGVYLSDMSFAFDTGDYVQVTKGRCVLDRVTVVGAITVASSSAEVMLLGCSVSNTVANAFALLATAGRVTLQNCYLYSDIGEALVLQVSVVAHVSNTRVVSTDRAAVINGLTTGRVTFDTCSFENSAGNPNYSTAFAVFDGPTASPQIFLRNCTFTITNCTRAAAVAPYVTFTGVDGRGLVVTVDTDYALDDYLLSISYSRLDGLSVTFAAAAPLLAGTPMIGAIYVTTGGEVRNLHCAGMTGSWVASLVYINSAVQGVRAVVDGFTIGSVGAAWTAALYGLAARLGYFGVLRRFVWDDVVISNAATTNAIVGVYSTTTNLDGAEFTDSVIVVKTAARARLMYLFYMSANAGSADAPGVKILRNRFHITPVQPNPALVPTYTVYAVRIGGHSVLATQNSEATGNLYGEFQSNHVHFDGKVVGSGASNLPSCGPVFFSVYAYMWTISGNTVVSSDGDVVTQGFNVFIYCAEESGGLIKGAAALGGGNLPSGNILREVGGPVGTAPCVASPDGTDSAGFYNGAAALLNVSQKEV